jgi:hypothetical protein
MMGGIANLPGRETKALLYLVYLPSIVLYGIDNQNVTNMKCLEFRVTSA